MQDTTLSLIQSQPDQPHLALFGKRLTEWLINDLNQSEEPVAEFGESRAKALLRASDLLDDPTRHSFERLVQQELPIRLALHQLLNETNLAENNEIQALAATTAQSPISNPQPEVEQSPISWLALAIAAYAWQTGYDLYQLDPASPPSAFSPAGQILKRAAYFVRQQVQRSATERGKLGRKLAFRSEIGGAVTPTLNNLQAPGTIAPVPPHYRPPIPVNYPEVARDTLNVDMDEQAGQAIGTHSQTAPSTADATSASSTAVSRNAPISITEDDLPPPVTRQSPIQISPSEIPAAPPPRPRVVTPRATVAPRPGMGDAVRKRFSRGREPMKSSKLRVKVQETPEGKGLYGLQIKVTCKGIKSYVAGTTNENGQFLCELPVPLHSGLTYDVDVTWPRSFGGETERKSVTLNADRREFTLPFFR